MFNFFQTKPKAIVKPDNLYTVLNDELERLHKFFQDSVNDSANNANIAFARIKEIQDVLLETLKKQPTSDAEIKDLQSTVTELLLHTNTDSKN